ncbi:MAG TPA: hypothetical protein VI199_03550 [Novosphingobium sp.]
MNPSEPPIFAANESRWLAILRLWPLHVLLVCAVLVLGRPAWQAARVAIDGPVRGGVQVDTSGAGGGWSGGRYMLDLPVRIVNGDTEMVQGVSLWVQTYSCPSDSSPTSACRRLTAFQQDIPARIYPGSVDSSDQQIQGEPPAEGEVLRITRHLQSVSNGREPADES